jgi:malonyl CoA-acyl carrier protein transacylase
MSVAFLFPGLGSLRAGMLHRLPDTAASATVLAEAEWAHPGGVAQLDTAEALTASEVARHVSLLVAGVAGVSALVEDEEVRPAVVVGHGLGSFAAAVAAGLLTLPEALRAVRIRAELLERAQEPPHDIGIRMAQHLATIPRRAHTLPYVACTSGECLDGDANGVFDDLARSVALPVRWERMTAALRSTGADRWVELPPGRAWTARLGPGGDDAVGAGVQVVSVEERGIAEAADIARGTTHDGADGADEATAVG